MEQEELEGLRGAETVIRIYWRKKKSIVNLKKPACREF